MGEVYKKICSRFDNIVNIICFIILDMIMYCSSLVSISATRIMETIFETPNNQGKNHITPLHIQRLLVKNVKASIAFIQRTLHKKPYFLFPNVPKRSSFQKNCTRTWSFLYYQERCFFPENMILFSRQKMKDDLSQKIYFCIFGKDAISFSYKHDITLQSKKQRGWSSPEKIHLKMTFSVSLKKWYSF